MHFQPSFSGRVYELKKLFGACSIYLYIYIRVMRTYSILHRTCFFFFVTVSFLLIVTLLPSYVHAPPLPSYACTRRFLGFSMLTCASSSWRSSPLVRECHAREQRVGQGMHISEGTYSPRFQQVSKGWLGWLGRWLNIVYSTPETSNIVRYPIPQKRSSFHSMFFPARHYFVLLLSACVHLYVVCLYLFLHIIAHWTPSYLHFFEC